MSRACLTAGALFGAAGVMLGAFGAHGLSTILDERAQQIWDTAVLYHLIHAVALLATGSLGRAADAASLRVTGFAFGLGIALFSGSLYALSLGGPSLLGPLTPIGGVCFIVGWLSLAWSQWRGRTS
ncbi:MAG: DUF423 domain-containing protein [Pseudomonadales bacterium]